MYFVKSQIAMSRIEMLLVPDRFDCTTLAFEVRGRSVLTHEGWLKMANFIRSSRGLLIIADFNADSARQE